MSLSDLNLLSTSQVTQEGAKFTELEVRFVPSTVEYAAFSARS